MFEGIQMFKNRMENIRDMGIPASTIKIKGPVVLVASGPSLDQSYKEIKKSELPVIACDSAVKPLLENGIRPQFCVSIDYRHYPYMKLTGLDLHGIKLIYIPCIQKRVVDLFEEKFFAYNGGGYKAFYDAVLDVDNVYYNTLRSSSHLALSIAQSSGANPIYFVGHDFKSGERTHAKGAVFCREGVKEDHSRLLDGTEKILKKHRRDYINAGGRKIPHTKRGRLKPGKCEIKVGMECGYNKPEAVRMTTVAGETLAKWFAGKLSKEECDADPAIKSMHDYIIGKYLLEMVRHNTSIKNARTKESLKDAVIKGNQFEQIVRAEAIGVLHAAIS